MMALQVNLIDRGHSPDTIPNILHLCAYESERRVQTTRTFIDPKGSVVVDIEPGDAVYIYDFYGEIFNFVLQEIEAEPEWFTEVAYYVSVALTQGSFELRKLLNKEIK